MLKKNCAPCFRKRELVDDHIKWSSLLTLMFSVYNSNFGIVEYAFFFSFFFVTVNEEFSGLLGTGFNDLNIGGIRSGKSPFLF